MRCPWLFSWSKAGLFSCFKSFSWKKLIRFKITKDIISHSTCELRFSQLADSLRLDSSHSVLCVCGGSFQIIDHLTSANGSDWFRSTNSHQRHTFVWKRSKGGYLTTDSSMLSWVVDLSKVPYHVPRTGDIMYSCIRFDHFLTSNGWVYWILHFLDLTILTGSIIDLTPFLMVRLCFYQFHGFWFKTAD